MIPTAEKLVPAIDKLVGLSLSAWVSRPAIDGAVKVLKACRARIEADAAWASHSEELSRKAITAAHEAFTKLTEGKLDQPAAYAAVAAIYDTTSGLIPPEVSNILNAILKDLRA